MLYRIVQGMVLFCSFSMSANSHAAMLLTWNTAGNTGLETTELSTSNLVGISASTLTLGSGITPTSNTNRFGGSSWFSTGNTAAGSTLAEAVSGDKYIEFIVAPTAGFNFSGTSFEFIWDRTATTGPSSVTLRSSLDGFASNLGSVTGIPAGGTTVVRTISLAGVANVVSATTFRLYGYAGTGAGGTGGFDTGNTTVTPNVVFNGSVALTPVPEASTLAFAAIGGVGVLARFRRRRKKLAAAK